MFRKGVGGGGGVIKWKGVGEITSTPKPPPPPAILPFVTDSFGILAFA